MFKNESVSKARKSLTAAVFQYRVLSDDAFNDVKMCISSGNKKIGRVLNVSLAPMLTCRADVPCDHFCYDIKACLQYPNTVIDARARNTAILFRDRDRYFNTIIEKISRRRKNKYFRWHVSGDIVDADYLARMIEIAEMFPDWIFWTYTKRYSIVNNYVKEHGDSMEKAIPENLHIMFSEWDGLEMENPYGFPFFTCELKDGNKNHEPEFFRNLHQCPGNCDICKATKRGCVVGESTSAKEH